MAELGAIAHVRGRDINTDKDIARVIWDSSAIIAREQNQFWLPESFGSISGNPDLVSRIILFQSVREELDRIYNEKIKDGSGIIKLASSSDDIWQNLQQRSIRTKVNTINIPVGLQSTIDDYVEASYKSLQGKKLSGTDMSLVDSAYQYAIQGITVAVMTSDAHILDVITDIKKKESHLPILCISPYNLEKPWVIHIDGKLLITDELIAKIMKASESSFHYYVSVSRRQWRPRNWKMDFLTNYIADDLLRISFNSKIPQQSDDVSYYPLLSKKRGENQNSLCIKFANRVKDATRIFTSIQGNPPVVNYVELTGKTYDPCKDYFLPDSSGLPWYRIDSNFLRGVNFL